MSTNHGFVDGNKRTTIILLHTVLTKSGYKLVASGPNENLEDAVERMVLDTVNHALSFDDLVDWFKTRIRIV